MALSPTRDAKVAFAHLVRAEEYRRAGNFGKVARHQSRAGWLASRAARGIVAFGTDSCAMQIARLLGAKDPTAPIVGIPNLGLTSYLSAALQCLFVTAFEVDKELGELRGAYAELKSASSGGAVPEATVRIFHDALRAVFKNASFFDGKAAKIAGEMEIKERRRKKGGGYEQRSNSVDILDFLPPLLLCSKGCTESECPYQWLEFHVAYEVSTAKLISEIEASIETSQSGFPRVLCACWLRYAPSAAAPTPWEAAPELIRVKGTRYELAAILKHEEKDDRYTAYTKRAGEWSRYDDSEVRTLDASDEELRTARIAGPVYFYQLVS